MKTTEELLEMPCNDLLKYCESLKFFTIDYDDFHILTTNDIILTKVVYSNEYSKIHIKLSYHFEKSNIFDGNFESVIHSISFDKCHDYYYGLFETEQDAINAVKQYVKHEILEQIDSRKLQIKELEKKIEHLENL